MTTSFVLSRACAGPLVMVLLGGLPAASAHAAEPSYSILYSFQLGERGPQASLVSDGSGNFYGTTAYGGSSDRGTVYTIKKDGTGFQRLHDFTGDVSDGGYPYASLILDGFGNLYGTTSQGGTSNVGTVFKLKRDGTAFQLLHSFAGGASDGSYPYASLTLDADENLYGTTIAGGQPAGYNAFGYMIEGGTVFKLGTDGSGFQLLHAFTGGASEGFEPEASLILDDSGNLYGTTARGGPSESGTAFTIRADGTRFKVLHSFAGGASDGSFPYASLTLDTSGNLYGTTSQGGPRTSARFSSSGETERRSSSSIRSPAVQATEATLTRHFFSMNRAISTGRRSWETRLAAAPSSTPPSSSRSGRMRPVTTSCAPSSTRATGPFPRAP